MLHRLSAASRISCSQLLAECRRLAAPAWLAAARSAGGAGGVSTSAETQTALKAALARTQGPQAQARPSKSEARQAIRAMAAQAAATAEAAVVRDELAKLQPQVEAVGGGADPTRAGSNSDCSMP